MGLLNGDIRLDIEDLEENTDKLGAAISDFTPYTTMFLEETDKILDTMSSDFITVITRVLNNMQEKRAPELVKKLESYKARAGEVIAEYKELDRRMENAISQYREGMRR